MNLFFVLLTVVFIVVAAVMILIILVQRPQGGGLAGAFGGAGGGSTDTVFGGRVGDALTIMTVVAFLAYLGLALGLNLLEVRPTTPIVATDPAPAVSGASGAPVEVTPSGPPPGFVPNDNNGLPPGQPVTPLPPPTAPSETQPPASTPETTPNSGD